MIQDSKEIATYVKTDPLACGTTYIAIDISTKPHLVFGAFYPSVALKTHRVGNIIILPRDIAAQFYEFKKAG